MPRGRNLWIEHCSIGPLFGLKVLEHRPMVRLLRNPASQPTHGVSSSELRPDSLRALVAEARRGDERAARTLLVALGPALLRVVRGVLGANDPDVEDVLQEAMVAVFAALPGFREECKTSHFACRIALQIALNARRRGKYRKRHTPSAAPEELDRYVVEGPSPADSMTAARRREALRGLLLELPTPQSEVLALHIVLGYSVEETAAVTGAPVNTVRSRLRAALASLRERVHATPALFDAVKGGA
jgi:RNA polymerase sigma factor (sigma-70 family)